MDTKKAVTSWEGYNVIVDEKEKYNDLNLNKGTYRMLSCSFDVLINKREGLSLESYDHLRNFRHDNAIPNLDFYIQADKYGRMVIPKVHSSFRSWFENGGKTLLFDENGHMTALFEKLILEYCDLISSLLKLKLIIEKFDMDNIYVNIFDEVPMLCVLIPEVKKVPCVGVLHRKLTWDCPRKFISWCEEQCNITRDSLTEMFCIFLGKKGFSMEKLKRYPHNWDDSMKGDYLMSLVASNHSTMRFLLQNSGLTWPFHKDPHNQPSLLHDILDWDKSKNQREHSTSDFFEYVILLRNCYKHLDHLPEKIKAILVDRRALIAQIEMWTPNFWIEVMAHDHLTSSVESWLDLVLCNCNCQKIDESVMKRLRKSLL